MNARVLAVLLVVLAALGGGALLIQQRGADKPAGAAGLGQPLLPGLQAADVAAIAIRQPKAALTIEKKGERWTIAERHGFPADFDKVRGFVLRALSVKIGQAEAIGEADRARLNLDASGTAVDFLGAGGKPLARLVAGRKYFKTEPDNPQKAIGDGRYVALPEDPKRFYIVADPLAQASPRSADWISRAGIAADKIKSLEVSGAAGAAWKVERSGDNADWKLAGARGDEKLEVTKANAAAYTFGQIELADVAPPGMTPEAAGLDQPTTVTAVTLDGLTYLLKIGKAEGENLYASVSVTGEPQEPKLAERVAREKALAGYLLLIPRAKLDDILKKRADMLAAKEAKKK